MPQIGKLSITKRTRSLSPPGSLQATVSRAPSTPPTSHSSSSPLSSSLYPDLRSNFQHSLNESLQNILTRPRSYGDPLLSQTSEQPFVNLMSDQSLETVPDRLLKSPSPPPLSTHQKSLFPEDDDFDLYGETPRSPSRTRSSSFSIFTGGKTQPDTQKQSPGVPQVTLVTSDTPDTSAATTAATIFATSSTTSTTSRTTVKPVLRLTMAQQNQGSQAGQGPYTHGPHPQPDPAVRQATMLASAIASQNAIERHIAKIKPCDGKSKDDFLRWIREVDLDTNPPYVARETATGDVLLELRDRPDTEDWPTTRGHLIKTFISPAFSSQQKDVLEELRQRPTESLLSFTREWLWVLKDAYPCMPRNEEPLVRTYLSALKDRAMARNVMKKRPVDVNHAIRLVKKEEEADQYLKPPPASKGKTHASAPADPSFDRLCQAMEGLVKTQAEATKSQEKLHGQVAALAKEVAKPSLQQQQTKQPPGPCYRCNKPGHWAKDCRQPQQQQPSPQIGPQCYRCRGFGHLARECTGTPVGPQCNRCRRFGHVVRDCRSAPPRRPCSCGEIHWLYDCPKQDRKAPTQYRPAPAQPLN